MWPLPVVFFSYVLTLGIGAVQGTGLIALLKLLV